MTQENQRFLHEIKRTHHCNTLNKSHVGQTVCLMGWVHKRRDHGGLIFVDLRDREGMTQVVLDPSTDKTAHAVADKVRGEFVLAVHGIVTSRPDDMINAKLSTGEIEVRVKRMEVLSEAQTPPFPLEERIDVNEQSRLKHRYIDLRRKPMFDKMFLRSRFCHVTRNFFNSEGFVEVETPVLYKTTPEGARDYLVPSRVHPGSFYALPQSPQTFKQLLMISGFDKYFQIVKCFRDEDLRADRQPEFTQLDLEMSFVNKEDVLSTIERYLRHLFKTMLNYALPNPLPRLTYDQAVTKYGSDKPDIRFGLELIPLTDLLQKTSFKVFKEATVPGKRIDAIYLPPEHASQLTRKDLDSLPDVVRPAGSKGVAWVRLTDEGWQSPIAKFLSDEEKAAIQKRTGLQKDGIILFQADKDQVVFDGLCLLRYHFRDKFDLAKKNPWGICWVTDFPLLEYNNEDQRFYARHHPFTMPHRDDMDLFMKSSSKSDLERVRAEAYDLSINGFEIFGGSIRIHQQEVQARMFELLALKPEEVKRQFGFFMEALEYGTPPHGGIAMGLDRMVMLMAGTQNIRDVIAFPKTHKGTDLMCDAPSLPTEKKLAELHLRVVKPVTQKNDSAT